MKFSVADLLDQLSSDQLSDPAQLAKGLKLGNKAEKETLATAIHALAKVGVLNQTDDGEVSRALDETLIDARLRCSSKGFCFAIRDDGGDDIYIRDHQLNHAWNGDRVLVKVTRDGGRRRSPEGGVQCILERSTHSLLAQVEQQNDQLIAAPLDDRVLANIHLGAEDAQHLSGDTIESVVEVHIDRYPVAQHPAVGHVVRSLPLNGGPAADRDLLLTKAGLQSRPAPTRSSGKSPVSKGRTDLTDQPALLLQAWMQDDAPGLPAVYVEAKDGGSRIWVHAPTVAERIGSGNSLDLCLRDRSEALCLGEVWQPLLTTTLNKASRFKPGQEADAISVRLDVNAEGELIDWEFMLSTVKPSVEVSTDQLKAFAARKPKSRTVPAVLKPIKDQLGQLDTLRFCCSCLSQNERNQGTVELDLRPPQLESLGDLRFADPSGFRHRWVDAFHPEDPHSFLQPVLRAADRAWGQHRADLQLGGLTVLRDEPDRTVLTDVAKTAIALDLPLELDEDGCPTAVELIQVFRDSEHRRVLEQQLSHALQQSSFASVEPRAAASSSDALESQEGSNESAPPQPGFSPWTCATLHYAHLINQQILVALLSEAKDRPNVRQKNRVSLGKKGVGADVSWPLFTAAQEEKLNGLISERLIQRLNTRRRQVLELEKDLLAMVQARSAQPLVGEEADGRISGVQSYGFFVEVGESRVEGLVHVSSLNDDWYEYRSRQNLLVGRKNRRSYQLGDAVRVRVMNVDVLRNQIDLEVICVPDPVEASQTTNTNEPLPVSLSET